MILKRILIINIYMETLTFNNVKEQQHMILEPLQVMINLALLNYCPIGTKISISNNKI